MADRALIGRCLGLAALSYRREDVGDPLVRVFELLLRDLPDAAVQAAFEAHLRSSKFFPVPADIIALAAESALTLPTPELAWSEVIAAIHRHGWCGTPAWSCEPIAQAVARMGWASLCETEHANIGVTAAQFRGVYSGLRAAAIARHANPALPAPATSPTLALIRTCPICHKILRAGITTCAACVPAIDMEEAS